MGRISIDFTAQGALQSPVYVNVEKEQVVLSLYLRGELYIPVKAIQMVKKPLQVLCSMWPDDKGVINIMEPAQWFVVSLCPLLKVFHKEVTDDRGEREARSHSIRLLIELATNREVCRSEDMPK